MDIAAKELALAYPERDAPLQIIEALEELRAAREGK
jgi:hypothetical protein